MRTNTQFCGILTFAIRSQLSVVLEEGKHLGENHQKLVIPAAYVKVAGKKKGRHDGGRFAGQIGMLTAARTGWTAAPAESPPSPYPWSYPVNSLEGAVECRLIRKSTPGCDIGKGQARIRHKIFGPIQPAFNQPLIRRPAKGCFEGPSKVAD
jgi:hypothetical protein